MSKEAAQEAISVMHAWLKGATIESRHKEHTSRPWAQTDNPAWNFYGYEYRVKPEPREFWVEPNEWLLKSSRDKPADGWIKVREVIE